MKEMEETVDKIVAAARTAVKDYGGGDQYWIYEEVIQRLQEEEQAALQMEYMGVGLPEDE